MQSQADLFRFLDKSRGTLGAEASADALLRLIYLRRCNSAVWTRIEAEARHGVRSLAWAVPDNPGLAVAEQRSSGANLQGISDATDWVAGLAYEDLADTFDAVVEYRDAQIGGHGADSSAPSWLARLFVALAPESLGSVFDPACGLGGLLLEAGRSGATSLLGMDVNAAVAETAQMRLKVHSMSGNVVNQDSLVAVVHRQADTVLVEPPLGMGLSDEQALALGEEVRRLDGTGAWVKVSQAALVEGGKAVLLVQASHLVKQGLLSGEVKRGSVETVALLPRRAIGHISVPLALVVLRKSPDPTKKVLVLDLEPMFERAEARGVQLGADRLHEIKAAMARWRHSCGLELPPHLMTTVEISEARTTGFNPVFAEAPEVQPQWPEPAAHLIESLRVRDFKAFAGEHRVPLARLNLIYGPNAVGKSAVTQSLLLLMQSVRAKGLTPNGPFVNLGRFENVVNRHDLSKQVGVGLSFGIVPPWPSAAGSLHPKFARHVDLAFDPIRSPGDVADSLTIGVGDFKPLVARSLGGSEHKWDVAMDSLSGTADLVDRDPFIGLPTTAQRSRSAVPRTQSARRLRSLLKLGQTGEASGQGLTPDRCEMPRARIDADVRNTSFGTGVNRILSSVSAELDRLAMGVRHLGPARPAPERFVQRSVGLEASSASNYIDYLYDNSSAVDEVNHWLDRIDIPYRIEVQSLGGNLPTVGHLLTVVLTDTRSGVKVSLADVGYGVSQLLPIVVECVRAREQVICIEQPELHLHPRLQGSVAELLIETTKASGSANQLIVETHSEHILFKVQRLVREGVLDAADVAVLYVDQDPTGAAEVSRIRVGSEGELLDPWPEGFFEDALDDLLGGV